MNRTIGSIIIHQILRGLSFTSLSLDARAKTHFCFRPGYSSTTGGGAP